MTSFDREVQLARACGVLVKGTAGGRNNVYGVGASTKRLTMGGVVDGDDEDETGTQIEWRCSSVFGSGLQPCSSNRKAAIPGLYFCVE